MADKDLQIVDLFSGAGGMSTGFEMAGFEVALGVEYIERFSETFAKNHPNAITLNKDIREVSEEEVLELLDGKKIDVVIGGPPCQGFSGAGRRDPKDPRNSLFMDFVRIVGALNPTYFVMENVPGILNMRNANDELVVEIIKNEFKKIGYFVEWRKLLAADYGVPQKRRRVIFIGCRLDSKTQLPIMPIVYPKQTHTAKVEKISTLDVGLPKLKKWVGAGTVLLSKEDAPEKSFHTQKMIDGFRRRKARNKANGKGFGWQIIDPEKPCYTISARYWKDGSDALVMYSDTEVRMLTHGEAAAIQTFPKDYEFVGSKKEIWMQIGNAVPCLLAKAIATSLKANICKPVPMHPIEYSHRIQITDFPLHWVTRIELFHPELEQFPQQYVHFIEDEIRVYGLICAQSIADISDYSCTLSVTFLSNIEQGSSESIDQRIRNEIEHRLGVADKISKGDILAICKGDENHFAYRFLNDLWDKCVTPTYGDYIPHGRLFDEMYGIMRFHSSGNSPKTGKQQEMRTNYWFLSKLGVKVEICGDWDFLEFFLLPTYDEICETNFTDFSLFESYYLAIKEFWNAVYTLEVDFHGNTLSSYPKNAIPSNFEDKEGKKGFISTFQPKFSRETFDKVKELIVAYNRMPERALGFIWSLMTSSTYDLRNLFSNRSHFEDFYLLNFRGPHVKVIACYLQQSFNMQAIPIDTWVECFIHYPLGFDTLTHKNLSKNGKQNFYNEFDNIAKLERIIWIVSQQNKTNKTEFLDAMWCTRFGVEDSKEIRGANPISCYKCTLRESCPGFLAIENASVHVCPDTKSPNTDFIVETSKDVPSAVWKRRKKDYSKVDVHTCQSLTGKETTSFSNKIVTVKQLINDLSKN